MPRLSRAQEQAKQEIVRRAGRGLLPAPLGGEVLRVLQSVIPTDGQSLYGVDPRTLLVNRVLAVREGNAAATLRWLRQTYLVRQGPLTFPAFTGAASPPRSSTTAPTPHEASPSTSSARSRTPPSARRITRTRRPPGAC